MPKYPKIAVAACKLVHVTENTTDKDRKTVEKEMKIHTALKHENVLEFLEAAIVELKYQHHYIPGIYMLLEFAAGGDLFDKIVPDVGVGEEVAHLYFNQLLAGMASPTIALMFSSNPHTRLPYIAPEVNNEKDYDAEPIDAWGVGVILFTLLAGNTPWDEPTDRSPEFCRYLSGEIFREDPWNRLGRNVLSLICGLLTVEPKNRMTLPDVYNHPWPSQLASRGVLELAGQLTQPLRDNGDLMYLDPDNSYLLSNLTDADGDDIMATAQSQFTQSLLLFSQTQSGRKYNPHLTRFYAKSDPNVLVESIKASLDAMNIQYRVAPPGAGGGGEGTIHIRVAGIDGRKLLFRGWIDLENYTLRGSSATFCVMRRDAGSPLTWRKFWKELIQSAAVTEHVWWRNGKC
ncbi:hypothetical protein ID866_8593 [Astraeus odoratus]|nr:hypothetical protein ID866_8593 [Astraeus odoratus]